MLHPNSDIKNRALKTVVVFLMLSFMFAGFVFTADAQEKKPEPQKQEAKSSSTKKPKSIDEERLAIIKSDIRKAIDEYKKLKAEADKTLKAADEKNQERVVNVAKMFESMPAEEAARRMEKLDDTSALTILKTLKPKSAGKILAQMELERAASLSKKMIPGTVVTQEKSSQ